MSLRIFITGASGFVGEHLTKYLSKCHPHWSLDTRRIDITDRNAVHAALTQSMPDVCVHLAAVSSIGRARALPQDTWNVNLQGTLNLSEVLQKINPEASFLFASTSEVYGDTFREGYALDERALLSPANTYATTKAAADLALGSLAHQEFHTIRLRPFNHTGAAQKPDFVVSAFARQLARIEAGLQPPVIEVGNLSAERDFIDVDDICLAYARCIEKRKNINPGTIINLCSGTARSIQSILDDLIAMFDLDIEVRSNEKLMRPIDITKAVGCNAKAKTILDWVPTTDWNETLDKVVKYWRSKCQQATIESEDLYL